MLTVGILGYTLSDHHFSLTNKCIDTFRTQADELIVVENGGRVDEEMRGVLNNWSDIYVEYGKNQGYTRGVNTILRLAKEPYIIVTNNDTELRGGNLKDLCIPDTVTSPEVFPACPSGFSGVIFCIPRTVLDKIGYLDERMKMRYSDTEFDERLRANHIPIKTVSTVEVFHHLDQTSHLTNEIAKDDQAVYEDLRHHANSQG